MGAILAILGDSSDPANREGMHRMIGRSPYRGAPNRLVAEGLILASMTLGWDAALGSWGDWLVAIHGYISNWKEIAERFALEPGSDNSEAEMLARAYGHLGDGLFGHLRGEFAILLFNRRSRFLLALTSPVGTRSLFYKRENGRVLFATEIRQILAATGETPALNEAVLVETLLNHPVPTGEMVYQGVLRILPAQIHRFSPGEEAVQKTVPYWEPPVTDHGPGRIRSDYADELRQHLKNAVVRALPSVPFALGLSGGLDSGAILAFLQELANGGNALASQCSVVSVLYPGFECDESSRIEATLARTGAKAESVNGLYSAAEFLDEDMEAIDLTTGPGIHDFKVIADPIPVSHRNVLLTGLGGDEWLTGDARYLADDLRAFRLLPLLRDFLPLWRRSGISLPRFVWRNVVASKRPFAGWGRGTPPEWLGLGWRATSRHSYESNGGGSGIADFPRGQKLVQTQLRLGQFTDLHPQIEQIISRQGLEIRHPFMDLDLVEFGFRTPSRELLARKGRKALMREALDGYLPMEVLSGPKVSSACLTARDALQAVISPPRSWSLVRRGILDLAALERLEASRSALPSSASRLLELWWFERFCARFEGREPYPRVPESSHPPRRA